MKSHPRRGKLDWNRLYRSDIDADPRSDSQVQRAFVLAGSAACSFRGSIVRLLALIPAMIATALSCQRHCFYRAVAPGLRR